MAEPCYVQFGLWLRSKREAAGLTQAEAAALLGMSRGSIANIEGGRQRIQLHTAEAIRACFEARGPADRLREDKIIAEAAQIVARRESGDHLKDRPS